MIRKIPEIDLRKYYTIFLQFGLIITLALLNVAVNIDITSFASEDYEAVEREIVEIEEIIQPKEIKTPPPPLRPQIPVEVPNDEIIEDVDINISEWDPDERLAMPERPPEEEEEEKIFRAVEHMPELIGGLASIQNEIEYPEMARRAGIEGRVYVQFIVNEQGEVEDPKVIRGIGGGADEEAIRAVRLAKFKPGLQRGRPVRVQYNLPVVFKLQN